MGSRIKLVCFSCFDCRKFSRNILNVLSFITAFSALVCFLCRISQYVLQNFLVLLRIPKSCKRTDSDGFVKKSADPDSVSDS